MSNEHPDMHGNWVDEPITCHHCERQVREEDCYGVGELLFCSAECVESWEDGQIESLHPEPNDERNPANLA